MIVSILVMLLATCAMERQRPYKWQFNNVGSNDVWRTDKKREWRDYDGLQQDILEAAYQIYQNNHNNLKFVNLQLPGNLPKSTFAFDRNWYFDVLLKDALGEEIATKKKNDFGQCMHPHEFIAFVDNGNKKMLTRARQAQRILINVNQGQNIHIFNDDLNPNVVQINQNQNDNIIIENNPVQKNEDKQPKIVWSWNKIRGDPWKQGDNREWQAYDDEQQKILEDAYKKANRPDSVPLKLGAGLDPSSVIFKQEVFYQKLEDFYFQSWTKDDLKRGYNLKPDEFVARVDKDLSRCRQVIREVIEEFEPDEACVACMDRKKTHLFVDCGHLLVCEQCAKRFGPNKLHPLNKCPSCRKKITRDPIKLHW